MLGRADLACMLLVQDAAQRDNFERARQPVEKSSLGPVMGIRRSPSGSPHFTHPPPSLAGYKIGIRRFGVGFCLFCCVGFFNFPLPVFTAAL